MDLILYRVVSIHPQDPLQQAIASLSTRDRKVKPISGDGNWLFRALAFVLYGSEMSHEKVRELLVQFVSENQDSFRPYIDCDFERYLSHMRCTRVWSTAVEILATASLLQNSVFTLIPSVNTYKWFRYNPLRGDRLTFPSQDPPPKQLSRLNHIELLNVRGCHYDYFITRWSYPLDEPPLSVHHYCV